MELTPYLFFNGRCEEALGFYGRALGAQIGMMMRGREVPDPAMRQPGLDDKIMHATFRIGGHVVMASDGMADGVPEFRGFSLSLTYPDRAAGERAFAALAEGGTVRMPLTETFYAERFGMVADRFGVSWMVLIGPKS